MPFSIAKIGTKFSEEQCRHLVRLSKQRHQQILYIITAMNGLEKKAKDIILKQVSKMIRWKMVYSEQGIQYIMKGQEFSIL